MLRTDTEEVHGAIRKLHIHGAPDFFPRIRHAIRGNLVFHTHPLFFGHDFYLVIRHPAENVHVHRNGIDNTRTGFLTELSRQIFKDTPVIVGRIHPRHDLPPGVKPEDVLTVETQIGIYHPGQLASHPQRQEKQERAGKTLHDQQPSMGTTGKRLPRKGTTIDPTHLAHRINHADQTKHQYRHRHDGENLIHVDRASCQQSIVTQPLHPHGGNQDAHHHDRRRLRQHPTRVSPVRSTKAATQSILTRTPQKD